ncbi:MAG: A/G-specific adenine glycosylase [Planctomycetota bacterium]|nr:A/G-specific adenine glycosylase [Planctomycetota bacterium]
MAATPRDSHPKPPFDDARSVEREIVQPLLAWFSTSARDLPWRRRTSPWRTLVSEFMLQQTQVSRVEERFEAFLDRYPTPAAMVAAGEADVLAAWEGMGYYRRARFLHATAKAIVDEHGGEVPADAAALLALPGVGRYTAGAIASIAFDLAEPIVDGNVARVVARLGGLDLVADDPELLEASWAASKVMVGATPRPGRVNEAVMELGATVCTPASPRCDGCPLATACRARAAGIETDVPRPKPRPVRTVIHLHLVLVRRGDELLLERRPRGGIWGGLWQPIGVESEVELEADAVASRLGDWCEAAVPITRVRRLLTHREVHLHLFEATATNDGTPAEGLPDRGWFDRGRAAELGCPKPVRGLIDEFGWSATGSDESST